MNIFSYRIFSLIIKEILSLFRDPKTRFVLIGPPILQLLVFSFAATLEVKNISVSILNQDTGKHGNEIIQRIIASPSFKNINFITNIQQFSEEIDNQKTIAGIYIPQDFSRNIESGSSTPSIEIILDGRKSNASQIVNSYIVSLITSYMTEISSDQTHSQFNNNVNIVNRNWFNPNLLNMNSTVPSMVAILSMLIGLMITSLSIARERELGTFDQILVSPLLPYEIMLGKAIPALVIGIIEGLLICGIGVLIFGIPFVGSILLLTFALFIFILSIVGIGLFISSISYTQQQSVLGTFIFMVPTMTLSGFATPVENMPNWLQFVTWVNPLKYALVVIKGLFLKNMPFIEVWYHIWPLLILAIITLTIASWSFKNKIG
jgi:ABC-2 type transport system permease protein